MGVRNPVDPLRVLVCGPDLLARVGLAVLLNELPDVTVVGQVAPDDLPATPLTVYQPDVMLWDAGWQPQSQVEAVTDAVAAGYRIVLLLPDPDAMRTVYASGVQGLLLRTNEGVALLAALRAVACGLTVFDPQITPLLLTPSIRGDETYPGEALTPVNKKCCKGWPGLSNKLLPRQLEISEHTVKFHVNAILGKLGAQSRTDAVVAPPAPAYFCCKRQTV